MTIVEKKKQNVLHVLAGRKELGYEEMRPKVNMLKWAVERFKPQEK